MRGERGERGEGGQGWRGEGEAAEAAAAAANPAWTELRRRELVGVTEGEWGMGDRGGSE